MWDEREFDLWPIPWPSRAARVGGVWQVGSTFDAVVSCVLGERVVPPSCLLS
jgi:hypothetical protein